MPKTIWYISKYVEPPHETTSGSRSGELMRELAALGHRSVVITSDANHHAVVPKVSRTMLRETRDGIHVYWLRTFKARKAKSWQRVVSWLHFEWRLLRLDATGVAEPDIVIISSPSLFTVLNGLRLKRRYRVPMVFEVRDIWPLTLTEEGGFKPSNPLIRALALIERLGYRNAEAIVGTMPALGDHVAQVLGRSREVQCIPMGYARRFVDGEQRDGRRSSGSPGPQMIVGYAGTIGITNALETLFDAARLLRGDPGFRFRIMGDGPLLEQYRELCSDMESVEFIGRVPKEQLQSELAKCDVLHISTYPSQVWTFGQSLNKLVDYMLSGRPVIASMSGYPSMIDEAGSGSFVPAGDSAALVEELRRYAAMSTEERTEMGRRGRTWILEHRSYEKLAKDYSKILFPSGPSD